MSDNSANNKRIAKNTLFLYFRTILIMLVTLYTSRVVLNTLGVEDFGVYNAVGGVVSMFAVISGALSNAISRYITYGLGKGDKEKLKMIFCTSVNIQIIIALIIFVLCEIVGLWFLNSRMNIPEDRLVAANWVLHCSLLTFVVNLISVPYNACIIAHEHMNAYAYISIFDAILKMSVAYLLIVSPVDKLIAYSVLLFVTALGVRLLYGFYCGRHFKECKYKPIYDRVLFKEMMGFAGWNFFGNATSVLNIQGVNILINVFFGVVANSARGIASQIDAAVNQLVVTFTTAVNPQITKSYAQGDSQRLNYLVCKGAKFSFFLLLLFAVPLFFEADTILKIWLVNVPEGASLFTRLALIGALVTILGNTGYTACLATGNIKKYSIVITLIGNLNFIFTWIAYNLGASVEMTYYIYILVYIVVLIARLMLMKEILQFPISIYFKEVIGKILLPTMMAIIGPFYVCQYFEVSITRVFIDCLFSILWTGTFIMLFGLTKGERITILRKLKSVIVKIANKLKMY